MKPARPPSDFDTVPPAAAMSFEWEELPVLPAAAMRRVPRASYAIADQFVRDAQARHHKPAPVWTETLPAIFDPLQPSAPLADTRIDGLATRELHEPDLFRHFFEQGSVR